MLPVLLRKKEEVLVLPLLLLLLVCLDDEEALITTMKIAIASSAESQQMEILVPMAVETTVTLLAPPRNIRLYPLLLTLTSTDGNVTLTRRVTVSPPFLLQ